MRRLMPTPFLKLPEFLREGAARYGTLVSFATWWRRFVLVNDPAPEGLACRWHNNELAVCEIP